MKKKRFFVKQKRGSKWTEEQTGRKIEFADKYLYEGSYSDKFDYRRPKQQNTVIEKEKKQRKNQKIIIAVLSIVLIAVGYTGMDAYMQIMATPAKKLEQSHNIPQGNLAQTYLQLSAKSIEGVALDNSVMLQSVIDDANTNGFTSLVFDAKRHDGTVGYTSQLAAIDTYSAISSPGSKPQESIARLVENNILPVARICCYKDNVVPNLAQNMALYQNGVVYTDSDGNTYLNPNSQNAYDYIKDIIQELNNYGVTVFILYGCDLPEEIGDEYKDGYDHLVSRLENELGTQIKFISEVEVSFDGTDYATGEVTPEAVAEDIADFPPINENQIYKVNTKLDSQSTAQYLTANGVNSFVIFE